MDVGAGPNVCGFFKNNFNVCRESCRRFLLCLVYMACHMLMVVSRSMEQVLPEDG
jgi:hypothetical protein